MDARTLAVISCGVLFAFSGCGGGSNTDDVVAPTDMTMSDATMDGPGIDMGMPPIDDCGQLSFRPDGPGCCTPDYMNCTTRAECCGGGCIEQPMGGNQCGACSPLGGPCRNSDACCQGFCALFTVGGRQQYQCTTMCLNPGSVCMADSDCCMGHCTTDSMSGIRSCGM
jgi:hypothetical protein